MVAPRTPLLSVVVPVYQVEAYLAECLDSVLAEAPPDVEVIAVDDCSPDRSGEILDRYAERDPRVRVLHLAANVGLSRARNAGLEQAAGQYVWFVDSDDWLPPGSVPAVMDRLRATSPDVLVIDHVEVFDDGRVAPGSPAGYLAGIERPVTLAQRPVLLRLPHSACTKVVRRAYLDEIELRFSPGWYEDCAYSHPLLLAAERIDALDRVCYCYRQPATRGSITKTVDPRHFDVFAQYERLFAFLDGARGAYDAFRPELFRLMVNHYLVIAGSERRMPHALRRRFFKRAAADYRRWRPPEGYPMPKGVAGLKHRLLRLGAYGPYAVLRRAYRAAGRSNDGSARIPSQATRGAGSADRAGVAGQ